MTSLERYFKEQDKIIAEDKEKTLIALGITEKEYAPDGEASASYPNFNYVDGEKRYYREVAANISDEEYAEVLKKKALVDAIRAKEQQELEKKQAAQRAHYTKKWLPIFQKPKSEWEGSDPEDETPTGKSSLAQALRTIAWIFIVLGSLGCLYLLFVNFLLAFAMILGVALASLLPFALAEILDHLAEQTAILRAGFIYQETKK